MNPRGIGPHAARKLRAQKQRCHAGDDGRGKARAGFVNRAAAGASTDHGLSRRENPVVTIGRSPIAKFERLAACIHCADGERGGGCCRHMQALTAFVSGRGDQQNVVLYACVDSGCEERFRLSVRSKLPTADIDDMRAERDRLIDGSREIQLRADDWRLVGAGREDRQDQAAAGRSETLDLASRLAEQDAGDVRPVAESRRSGICRIDCRLRVLEMGPGEAGVRLVNGAVKHGHPDARIAGCDLPDPIESGQRRAMCDVQRRFLGREHAHALQSSGNRALQSTVRYVKNTTYKGI